MREKGAPLVRVASAPNAAIAAMWEGLLDNEGIPALIRMAGPLTGYVPFASPHDLLVLATDAEAARDLLAAFNEDERDLVGAEEIASDATDMTDAGDDEPRA